MIKSINVKDYTKDLDELDKKLVETHFNRLFCLMLLNMLHFIK